MDHAGKDLMPVGEVGELILNGPNIMQGYWKRPEGTDEAFVELEGENGFAPEILSAWTRKGISTSLIANGI